MSQEPSVAVIVPAYNAAHTLLPTLRRIPLAALPPIRLFVVNDGSSDATAEVAARARDELEVPVELLCHSTNRGYGAAQKTGLRATRATSARAHVLIHADGQYAPEELPQVLAPILEGRADVCVGSRILSRRALAQGMPTARFVGNRLISFVENAVFGLDFVEYHSGYMAYSTQALQTIPFEELTDRFHFDGEMLLCAGKLGLPVAEVPVSTHFGEESSSLAPIPYILEITGVLVRFLRGGFPFQRRGAAADSTDRHSR
jgi:glycosyltransferase involved in cell wall biosynthesis